MTTEQNKVIILAEHPKGVPTENTFKINAIDMPILKKDEVFLKSLYVSVDPGMRGFMNKGDDDAAGKKFEIGKPITSRTVAQILESKSENFKKGDIVHGAWHGKNIKRVHLTLWKKLTLPWRQYRQQ